MTESVLRANFTVSTVTYQIYEIPPSNVLVVFVEMRNTSVPETIITSMRNHLGNLSAEAIITGFHPSCTYVNSLDSNTITYHIHGTFGGDFNLAVWQFWL